MLNKKSFPIKLKFSNNQDTTAYGGLISYLKILTDTKILYRLPSEHNKKQGWLDGQMILSLLLLN